MSLLCYPVRLSKIEMRLFCVVMKPFCRALLALILVIGFAKVEASETIYFLVGEWPSWMMHNDSYVLSLSKQEDIDHARYLILRAQSGFHQADNPIVVANVVGGKDSINRNYLNPKLPEWSWQIGEFLGFADITAEILDGNPTQLEWYELSPGIELTIGFWDYTVVKELGPVPLYLSVVAEWQYLQFYWSGVGTNYVYTLEGKESLASTNWFEMPGASWPLKTNHWTLPLTNTPARFYRVKAEQANP